MLKIICSVRDRVADCFGNPFFVPAEGVALRSFSDEINRPAQDNALYQHPADFELFVLGVWDDADASFKPSASPRSLALGDSLKKV